MYYKEYGFKITPGNGGKECKGNGTYKDDDGNEIECLCDECDFFMCCIDEDFEKYCENCDESECVHCKNEEKM